ncbi:DNA-3-methyladenine glycosylase family protein [Paenibacillus taiwanensis]|uniref:DNA-3-methyladenine glycosylase family protein n=1 Tax=Paenibacillus taiwanensis TaxID=401638 RepID=UPI0004139E42|nr:DNA-3-methyladenine glycosylase 2 [Paenibacillus taiwanensis]
MTERQELQAEEIIIDVPALFRFDQNVNYLSRSANECMLHVEDKQIIKAIPLKQENVIVAIREGDHQTLAARIWGLKSAERIEAKEEVVQYIRNWFDLDTDLEPFYLMAEGDTLLQPTVDSFYGLRIVGISNLFEAICWGIIGQQINLAFAYTLKRRFVEKYGTLITHNGYDCWLFPSPQSIASLSVKELEALQFTSRKSEYIIGVARLIADGSLSKERLLATGSCKDAERMLVQIRGIGPWTANYVIMRCLRLQSAFPIDDVGLHNAIKLRLAMDRKPTKDEIINLSRTWTNWEAYATFYLWRWLY